MEGDDKFPRAAAAEENNLTGRPKKQIDAGLVEDNFHGYCEFWRNIFPCPILYMMHIFLGWIPFNLPSLLSGIEAISDVNM